MNAAIIRIWNCFTVVASSWSIVNYAHQACFDSAKAEICRKFLNRIWHHLNCCLFFLSNCFRLKVKGFKGNGPNPSRDVYMRLDNTANFPAECSVYWGDSEISLAKGPMNIYQMDGKLMLAHLLGSDKKRHKPTTSRYFKTWHGYWARNIPVSMEQERECTMGNYCDLYQLRNLTF